MGLFTRLLRLCKADMHGVMDQLEDKELLLKQYLREMEDDLQHKEAHLNQLTNALRRFAADLEKRAQDITALETDLDLAVRKGKDEIAKLLIRKQRVQNQACDGLRQQIQQLEEDKNRLARIISDQRLEFDRLKLKAGAYCQQAQQRQFEEAHAMTTGTSGLYCHADEEEIELELLRRKDALQPGGSS